MCLPVGKKHDAVMGSAAETWPLLPWKQDPGQRWGRRLLSRWRHTLPLVATILTWLATGSTMSSLNKWIFAIHNFRYPVLLSSLHMLTAVVVGRPLARLQAGRSGHPSLHPKTRLRVFLLSLTFCASVAFGNLGLNHVQLDFAQMVYTTTPLFTLTLSELLLRKRHHPLQYVAMGPICLGASLSFVGEVHFDQAGCCFLFAATFLRGLKSIQQSTLLQEEHLNSLRLLCLTSLPSFCLLFVAALGLELGWAWEGLLAYEASLWTCVLLSCLGSVLYNLASFCILSLTSALTIHVLGNFNVVGNLLLSHWLFGSHLTLLSYAGIALTLLGVLMYHHSEGLAACWRSRAGRAKKE
ncbi:solute carrier family 35 member E4 isoform X1 [Ahaetulla prasina]|uniref:solute carrier family 35 member E4 isoform X1 n=1 Tax=Ahaetulla prasina TaxID=499056 RepID=UPI0026498C8B|nr:solute carrier family 35 member E4 isoform X1 [Ahaetulla prasina]